MTGDETEGDYITKRDHDIIDEINKRQEAERKLDALTRWRKQSEEPCPNVLTDVEYSQDGTGTDGKCCYYDLEGETYWRHTPESFAAMEKAKTDGK
jgi:hypothetical protein